MSHRSRRASLSGIAVGLALALSAPAGAAPMSDAWITTKAKMSLILDDASMASVHVDTLDGRITLHGTVESQAEKAKAEQIARGIEGVGAVRNLLQVVPPPAEKRVEASDAQLKDRVKAALAQDQALADSDIEVESVSAGVVVLGGTAKTLSDHLRALELTAGVPGVARVASEIRSPDRLADAEIWYEGPYDAARAAGSAARDMWVTSAVKVLLLADMDTPARDINVDSRDGVVTLFGTVPSEAAKQAASADVRKVGGVRSVQNELQVVAAPQQERVAEQDDDVENAVEERLEARGDLAGSKIDVEVSNGVARLSGKVASQGDRLTALTVARATAGVRAVVDDLSVDQPAVSAR